jgi:hypothetical protein
VPTVGTATPPSRQVVPQVPIPDAVLEAKRDLPLHPLKEPEVGALATAARLDADEAVPTDVDDGTNSSGAPGASATRFYRDVRFMDSPASGVSSFSGSVFVMGPGGSGKSSLTRTMCSDIIFGKPVRSTVHDSAITHIPVQSE